jgi:fructosamine-3-kinase
MHDSLIADLLQTELGLQARAVSALAGGQVGRVFRVDTDAGALVVKFVRSGRERSFSKEPPDDRVYGARWSNLLPAYELLKRSGVAAPTLRASGNLIDEGLHYEVLDHLDGDADDFSSQWFSALGKSLGQLHAVTRPWQGWVAMGAPYAETWTAAFAASFQSRLAQAKPIIGDALHPAIEDYVRQTTLALDEPEDFVFSHTDGFQGVFRRTDRNWRLMGVIDIEDHQFTDQRFVLAGLELSHAWSGRVVPPAFWNAYGAYRPVDRSYPRFRKLFQLYYLLVWARVLKGQGAPFETCIAQLQRVAG